MSKPLLCVTVTAPTTAELRRRRDEASGADIVELRLDSVRDPDVAGALAGRSRPVIVTCRPTWEGGQFNGSEDERHRILADAFARGAEYVDVEWRAGFDDLVREHGGTRTVLSNHDFNRVPDDLSDIVRTMRATGAGVVKVAVNARRLSDCVTLRELGAREGQDGGLVLIGMGEFGVASRVLAGHFASRWTYAGSEQHVGQLSASSLEHEYRFRALTPATALYGLVGLPVSHSVSPAMHNAAFKSLDIDAVYLPLPAVDADDVVTFGRAFGIKGFSVTVPHKVALFDRVDEVEESAAHVGAINTIRVESDRWHGANTDVEGFLQPLENRVALAGLRVSILGTGGSARAAAAGLVSKGCHVRVHGRTAGKAAAVAAAIQAEVGPYPPEAGSWDLLVNCTPVGMYPKIDETPIDAGALTGRYVYDLVYNPVETRLMREGARRGCETFGGLEMLVAQAAEQFRSWTGVRPPLEVMRAAAVKRLAEFIRDEDYVV